MLRNASKRIFSTSTIVKNSTKRGPVFANNLKSRGVSNSSSSSRADGDFIPITWKGVVATFSLAGLGMYYLNSEKQKLEEQRRERELETQALQYGKPKVGGPFTLTDCDTGKRVTEQDFMGKFMIIYFGFTNCPDVCPDELEKMSVAISKMDKLKGVGDMVNPVFISVDPGRDTPEVVKRYIKEFHPRFIGLCGTDEEIQNAAKSYRIYISKGEASDDGDYLVDHSIFFFLMDPEGGLADFYGRNSTADDIVQSVMKHIKKWDLDKKANRI